MTSFGGQLDIPCDCGWGAFHLQALDGKDGRRLCPPVRAEDRDDEREPEEKRATGRDEPSEIQAIAGRAAGKRDDNASRARSPARSALGPSPGHRPGFAAAIPAPTSV